MNIKDDFESNQKHIDKLRQNKWYDSFILSSV
jgi:hypothetical protein